MTVMTAWNGEKLRREQPEVTPPHGTHMPGALTHPPKKISTKTPHNLKMRTDPVPAAFDHLQTLSSRLTYLRQNLRSRLLGFDLP